MLQALCADNPAILTETVSALSRKFPDLPPDEIMKLATPLICPDNIDFPELVLNPETAGCHIGINKPDLSPAEFAIYWLMAIRHKNRLPPLRGEEALFEEFRAFAESTSSNVMPEIIGNDRFKNIDPDTLRTVAENISRKIEASVEIMNGMVHFLPVKGMSIYGISVPSSKIFCPRNY
ncbi:MAG: hypothetical protein WC637_04540 [Victivallales bacterium]